MFKWVLIGALCIFGISACSTLMFFKTTVTNSAKGVVTSTLDPDNVLATYERFHDRWKAFEARKLQIISHQSLLKQAETIDERTIARLEIQAMKQSCREIAANYNADSAKINRNIFKGKSAPPELNMSSC